MSEQNPYQAPLSQPDQTTSVPVAGLAVTNVMLAHLRLTRPWARFMAVLGFIGFGFAVLVGITAIATSAFGSRVFGGFPLSITLGVTYLAFAVATLFPTLALNRFANSLTALMVESGPKALETAMARLHAFWKTSGILVIVDIGLVLVFTFGTTLASLAATGLLSGR